VFRRIELITPAFCYSRLEIRSFRHEALPEDDLRALIAGHGFSVAKLSYALKEDSFFVFRVRLERGVRVLPVDQQHAYILME
jgi:putative Mg2+ transporter-C (MgtC) family protein